MNYTANYNLKKPEGTDTVNIDDFNNNADILDTEINSISEQIDNLMVQDDSFREQINNLDDNKADLVGGKVPSEQLPDIEVPVLSVNSKTGNVTITKADVGLSSVDNTTDSTKNVLSATKLTTARTINGVSFNGTSNITIPTTDATKAPTNHASTGTAYGVGTIANYGHVKVRNDLNAGSFVNGESLSAYQGKVLNDKLDELNCTLIRTLSINLANGASAIAIPSTDFENYNEFIFVVRGTFSSSSKNNNYDYFYIGIHENNSITQPRIAVYKSPPINDNKPMVSEVVEKKTWMIRDFAQDELYLIRGNVGLDITTPYFMFYKEAYIDTVTGMAYLDIYRKK